MKSDNKQYAVLGLGVFGSTVVKTLCSYNAEVIAIDKNMECVQRLADVATSAIQGDITDIKVLRNAGVEDCDVAIVGLGSHLEEALLCTMNLKELGIPYIIAKAKNKRYKQILEQVGADKVVRPEKEMGVVTARGLLNRSIIGLSELDEHYSVVEILVPTKWLGKTLSEVDVRKRYGINVIGIRCRINNALDISPSPDYRFEEGDHLLMISDSNELNHLEF